MSYHSVATGIPLLVLHCCPTAIFRAISEFVVYSVKGVLFRWPWTHIEIEISKTFWTLPSFAYGYAACAIVSVCLVVFVSASAKHRQPSGMFSRSCHLVRFSAIAFAFFGGVKALSATKFPSQYVCFWLVCFYDWIIALLAKMWFAKMSGSHVVPPVKVGLVKAGIAWQRDVGLLYCTRRAKTCQP